MTLPLPTISVDGSNAKLTEMQARFVQEFVSNPNDKEQAAINAGYSKDTARVQAYELLKKPHVMQAILEHSAAELVSHTPKAVTRLHQLLNGRSEYVALQAAQDILNRTGIKTSEKVDHRIAGDISVNIDLS